MQYCFLQHRTLVVSPDTSTTGRCFCFGSISSFFLELFLHWFPVALLGTYWPGEFIFQCPIFLPFHIVHEVIKARILKWFAFPSPMDPVLPELSTMTHPSWVALHSMAHSFIELDKAVIHVIRLVSFFVLVVFSLSALWWRMIRGLWKLPDVRDWQGETESLFWWMGPCSVNL